MIERMLLELPSILDEQVSCAGKQGFCINRPVVQHPQTGLYYCSGCAWTLMENVDGEWMRLGRAIEERHTHFVLHIKH